MSAESGKNYWLTSGMFTLLQRFGVQVFGLGMAPIIFRAFSPAQAGIWFLFLTTVSVLEVSRVGLQQNALIKFLANCNEEDYRTISTASLVLNFIMTAFMILSLILGAKPLANLLDAPDLEQMLYIYCLTTVILIPFFQFNYTGQANLDFKGMFWSDFSRQGMLFFFILGMFLTEQELTLIGLAKMQVLTALAGSGVAWYTQRDYLRFAKKIDRAKVLELFHFGKYVLGTNLSTMIYKTIDKFMLGGLIGTAAAGVYEVAIKVTNMAEIPTHSMANILFPQSARRMKEEKRAIRNLYEKAVGAIFALLLPGIVFVLLFADIIILIVAGEQYQDSANILRLTILYGLFIPFAVQFGTVLDSIGKPKINFLFTFGGAALNIVLNYIFIRNFGIIGAAYGTLVTYSLTFVGMQWILYRMFEVKSWRVFQHTIGFYEQLLSLVKTKLNISPKTS